MSSTDDDEIMTARGNCYHSCFQGDLPEITIHSIMGFGSRHVEKMKIVKVAPSLKVQDSNNITRELNYHILDTEFMNTWAINYSNSEIIYNEDHVNIRYQAFKVIRSSKIKVYF